MVGNNSSTGGYLTPSANNPLEDNDLEDLFHDLFTNITGLAPSLVRPRWVVTPGNLPDNGVNWIAQGITNRKEDVVASQIYKEGIGIIVNRNEELDILVSIYGTNNTSYYTILRDGLSLDQNREYINRQGVVLVAVGNPRNTSELVNNHWVKRTDVVITFRRLVARVYPVLSLLAGDVDLYIESELREIIEHIHVDHS